MDLEVKEWHVKSVEESYFHSVARYYGCIASLSMHSCSMGMHYAQSLEERKFYGKPRTPSPSHQGCHHPSSIRTDEPNAQE